MDMAKRYVVKYITTFKEYKTFLKAQHPNMYSVV